MLEPPPRDNTHCADGGKANAKPGRRQCRRFFAAAPGRVDRSHRRRRHGRFTGIAILIKAAEDQWSPEQRGEDTTPQPHLAIGVRHYVAPACRDQCFERCDPVRAATASDDQLVSRGLHSREPVDPGRQGRAARSGSSPRHQPASGGNRRQDLRDQIVRGLKLDQVVCDGGFAEPNRAIRVSRVGVSTERPSSQRVNQSPVMNRPEPCRRQPADTVRPHQQPPGSTRGVCQGQCAGCGHVGQASHQSRSRTAVGGRPQSIVIN